MTRAYIGIGSNLGEPQAQVRRALDELAALPRSRLAAQSSLYRTQPVGHTDQPDFVNAVAAIETPLTPEELLSELQRLERLHGRTRSFDNAPRTLDLDLLLYGNETVREPGLVVPHPRMHERRFVLAPLVELAPAIVIPGRGPAASCLAGCAEERVERIE